MTFAVALTGHPDSVTAAVFLLYWLIAFLVLCPMAWVAIGYDMSRRKEWPLVLKRLYLGFHVAVLLGSGGVVFAASKATNPQPTIIYQDPCDLWKDLPWWERLFLGCV